MRSRTFSVVSIFLLFVAMAGVTVAADQTATLPVASDVANISVRHDHNQPTKRITDRPTIERALKLISENNRGWETSWNTFPTPSASAVFETEKQSPHLVLWFGKNWLGARVEVGGKLQNHFWRAPPEIQIELRRLLGINA